MLKSIEIILKEMCNRVNVDFSTINFKEDWYLQHNWSIEDELDFKDWLISYLKENKDIRLELNIINIRKDNLEKFANFFIFNYGWRLNNDKYVPS